MSSLLHRVLPPQALPGALNDHVNDVKSASTRFGLNLRDRVLFFL